VFLLVNVTQKNGKRSSLPQDMSHYQYSNGCIGWWLYAFICGVGLLDLGGAKTKIRVLADFAGL
jgi:hypothetical protein